MCVYFDVSFVSGWTEPVDGVCQTGTGSGTRPSTGPGTKTCPGTQTCARPGTETSTKT